MAADISKHLERAKRFLEKNRVEDAIEAYLAVIEAAPQHQDGRLRRVGICGARMEQPTARRCTTECCSICWLSRATRSRRWRSTTGFCGQWQISSRPSALRATHFCNKNRIDTTKRSSSIRGRRKMFSAQGGSRRVDALSLPGSGLQRNLRSGQYSTTTEASGSCREA